MNNILTVTLIQTHLFWEDIAANLQQLTQKIATIDNTDLIVLPETFSTGFSMRATALAEDVNSSTAINWMRTIAAQKHCVVTGSLMLKDKNLFYNRLIWMRPNGTYQFYNKRHLFSLSAEPQVFTPGTERLIVELNGWKICPLICYDLRFATWARNSVNHHPDQIPDYDILLYVANWPERRNTAWKTLLPARAVENLAYAVGVNRVGVDGENVTHTGNSMVVDALGNTLYYQENTEAVFTVELHSTHLKQVRKMYPFLKDAD